MSSTTENSDVSSANSLISACKPRGESLIQIRNKSGPKTGTPSLHFFSSKLIAHYEQLFAVCLLKKIVEG